MALAKYNVWEGRGGGRGTLEIGLPYYFVQQLDIHLQSLHRSSVQGKMSVSSIMQ